MEKSMYYLKLDSVTQLNENQLVAKFGEVSFVVDQGSVISNAPNTYGPEILKHLSSIVNCASAISQLTSGTTERRERPEPKQPKPLDNGKHTMSELGLPEPNGPQMPFVLNETTPKIPLDKLGKELNQMYQDNPGQRNMIINRIAGMVRLDMLELKEHLSDDIRRAVVGSLMRRDSLKTPVIPPDLSAFLDPRPLSETLGSRSWDPGSEKAKDSVSSNWAESERIANKIASEVDESEFAHMYPTTESASMELNRKYR
jgi:hypothetical protein